MREEEMENTTSEAPEGAQLDTLTGSIIPCIIKVHKALGPGFHESVYRNALVSEMTRSGLAVESEKEIPISYEGQVVGSQKLDAVVENQVILKLMTVEGIAPVHYAQMRSYLRATGLKVGLVVNFALERSDFRRVEL